MAAAAPRALLLLGILLAAFLLLSSRVTDAAKDLKETNGIATDATGGDEEVATAQQAGTECGWRALHCCRWAREGISGRRRCIQCCRRAAGADPAQVDGVMKTEDPQN